uniref:Uncharacterized protein n=1 Tax=Rhizophora mucronata TaxID=61149 RepID=A0A2P2LBZ8_RHIMU
MGQAGPWAMGSLCAGCCICSFNSVGSSSISAYSRWWISFWFACGLCC